ncbi:MAG: cyclophilin-like fold protein [Chloroflexi bacterium]|jgi:hypothetical protein|nr:cyclophilin-like fold protein [Chloroflexota bacterium]
MRRIQITAGGVAATATLDDSGAARAFWDALPITGSGNRWGQEIYFEIPVQLPEAAPRALVDRGDIAFWGPGNALCIFFGPTPVSGPGEIRPASPVSVFGRVEGDPGAFTSVPDGATVAIDRLEPSAAG